MATLSNKRGEITLSESNEFVTVEVFRYDGAYSTVTMSRFEWDILVSAFNNGQEIVK